MIFCDLFLLPPHSCSIPPQQITFKWGRKDCPGSPVGTAIHNFPLADMKEDDMFKWFKDEFDFNPQEVTAIMGGHTLGRSVAEHTGGLLRGLDARGGL